MGWSERTASEHVYYQVWNRSPVQVGCTRQVLRASALGWPREMGWGGSWEGVSGWGTHVNPWLIHVNVWLKPQQYCKVISLQLIKIIGKKIKASSKQKSDGFIGLPSGSMVKNPPAMQEPQEAKIQSLHQEDPPAGENDNPLQYSCLKNPMERETWSATGHGVAESQRQLKCKYSSCISFWNFQKTAEKVIYPNSFCEATITLISIHLVLIWIIIHFWRALLFRIPKGQC